MLSKTHTKYIQSLQHKKFRDSANCFIAEGPKVVPELLGEGLFACKEVFALKDWLEANEQLQRIHDSVLFHEVQDFELEKISTLST
ncbi:MAG TPA: RNA methyltransferase, partial [Ferruginibacter sp.]|nr:RNA methyltransferase [Chitinophagaceae bacterium]HRI25646.1 RNA methyltransferase [Ferruginibacter sp.]